ncbi:MAG: HAD family hydrolase [Clostridia bacterium]|nr:HAD family hydrolase [Clostridia bacterium]
MNGALFCSRSMDACSAGLLAMKRPVLIVFDLDGTLTDSYELGHLLFKEVFRRLGFGEISDEMADSFNGPSSDEVCRIMGIEDRKAEYNALIDEVETELVRKMGKIYPGVIEMLETLAPHAHLSILTNGSSAYCETCIEHYGFAPYIGLSAGFTSGVSKAMRIGMWERELGVRRVIVVGDRSTDISNARAANACAIGVTFGMGSREELLGADVLCDNAQQVTQACMRVIAEI